MRLFLAILVAKLLVIAWPVSAQRQADIESLARQALQHETDKHRWEIFWAGDLLPENYEVGATVQIEVLFTKEKSALGFCFADLGACSVYLRDGRSLEYQGGWFYDESCDVACRAERFREKVNWTGPALHTRPDSAGQEHPRPGNLRFDTTRFPGDGEAPVVFEDLFDQSKTVPWELQPLDNFLEDGRTPPEDSLADLRSLVVKEGRRMFSAECSDNVVASIPRFVGGHSRVYVHYYLSNRCEDRVLQFSHAGGYWEFGLFVNDPKFVRRFSSLIERTLLELLTIN